MQFVNKTFDKIDLQMKVIDSGNAELSLVGEQDIVVEPNSLAEGVFFIKIPKEDIKEVHSQVVIGVYNGDKLIEKVKTKFLGPAGR